MLDVCHSQLPHGKGAGLRRLTVLQGRMWLGMRSNVEQKAGGIGSIGFGVVISWEDE